MESNVQKIRDAIVKLDKLLFVGIDGYVHGQPDKTEEIELTIKNALSIPLRNCDVGTAEEQAERFAKYCDRFHRCNGCPCCGKMKYNRCEYIWAQMPYEGGAM